MENLGQKLRSLREQKGHSQLEAAKLLNINNKTLSDYERNISEPDLETVKNIANLYEVPIDYLLGNTKNISIPKDEFQFALYGEVKDLSEEEKQDILEMVKILKKRKERK